MQLLKLHKECKTHGEHLKWIPRADGRSGVRCLHCIKESRDRGRKQYPIREKLKQAKCRSKKLYREFAIDEAFVMSLLIAQGSRCALTGQPFKEPSEVSIDRIDSSKGYTADNVQLVLHNINRMKSDFNQEDFITFCQKVAQWSTQN